MAHDDLDRAILVASRAFDGRVDRQGQPYIAHSIRVMLDVATDDERTVAIDTHSFELSAEEFWRLQWLVPYTPSALSSPPASSDSRA